MLTISKPLTTGQAHSYHQEEFANTEQNYYTQGDRALGEWHGRLAGEWELAAKVSSEQFHRLAEGQHPITGEQLVRHRFPSEQTTDKRKKKKTAEHRAGWDATFSAPKSVSITALVGGDKRVREAHREAVNAALNELERYIQARMGGNRPAETTGRMIAAKFEHDSSRPVSGYSAPQLHTHVVIFNITQSPDGKTHALQPRELYKSQAYATAIYRSDLAHRLRNLGYELDRGKEGEFHIKGYTQEYIAASSPRRKQIQEYLQAHQITGAEAAEIGAHKTRDKKIHLTPAEMKAVNLALAAEHRNDPVSVVRQAQARRHQVHQRVDNAKALASAQAGVTYARDRNTEREAVVEERLLVRDALKRAMGDATLDQIRGNLDKRIQTGEFVEVKRTTADTVHRSFTTRQMLAHEKQNIAIMTSGQGANGRLVQERNSSNMLSSEFRHLSDAQRRAVTSILESRDKITGFQGVAGSGKTTTLSAVRRAAEEEGYSVRGFAPTSRAAHGLEKAGIASSTLQQFLVKGGPRQSESRRLYVLDESSLASTVQVNQFFKRLRPDDRVLLVGDIRQHQAVDAGKPFEQFQQAGMRTARLEELVRPRDPGLKAAIGSFASGDVESAIQQLKDHGRIHQFPDKESRFRAITADYLRVPEKTLVVSPDNDSRLEINRQIHLGLQALGNIAKEEIRVSVLTNRHELTGADRQWAAKYEPGDVIRYTRGSTRFRLKAEEYAYVTQVDTHANLLTVQRKNGQEITYDPKRLQGVNVYKREERHFAKGDRVQFTAPFKEQQIANRTLARVEKVSPDGNIELRLDSDKTVRFNLREHAHLDYGYAMTSYTSQGQTVDRVIIHVPEETRDTKELINQRFGYVAISRARHDAQIYTNDAATLADRLSRDVSKTAAIEIQPFRQSGHVALHEGQKAGQEQLLV
ncbi:MAG: conjugative relaxase [Acidobacteria bacterium]|nr:MAG: conjugative relaxase [Acidobacteriota bacterium]